MGGDVGGVAHGELFVVLTRAELADDDWAGMDTDSKGEAHTRMTGEAGIERANGVDDGKGRAYGAVRIVLVGLGEAEVDENAVAEILGDVASEALYQLGGSLLQGADDVAEIFRVELTGEAG
jgi:hypothetical protein